MSNSNSVDYVQAELNVFAPVLRELHDLAALVVCTPRADAYEASLILADALLAAGIILDPKRGWTEEEWAAHHATEEPKRNESLAESNREWATRWAWRWMYGADKVDGGWGGCRFRTTPAPQAKQEFLRMTLQRLAGIDPEQIRVRKPETIRRNIEVMRRVAPNKT